MLVLWKCYVQTDARKLIRQLNFHKWTYLLKNDDNKWISETVTVIKTLPSEQNCSKALVKLSDLLVHFLQAFLHFLLTTAHSLQIACVLFPSSLLFFINLLNYILTMHSYSGDMVHSLTRHWKEQKWWKIITAIHRRNVNTDTRWTQTLCVCSLGFQF